MATTTCYSFKERAAKLRTIAGLLSDMITMNRGIESYRDKLMSSDIEEDYATIKTNVTQMLNKFAYMGATASTLLLDFDDDADTGYDYECLARPYTQDLAGFVQWTVDINNGGKGVITAGTSASTVALPVGAGAPFTGYVAGDVVTLSNFNNPDTNSVTADGNYTVFSVDVAKQTLTLTAALTGLDSDADTTGYIRIKEKVV